MCGGLGDERAYEELKNRDTRKIRNDRYLSDLQGAILSEIQDARMSTTDLAELFMIPASSVRRNISTLREKGYDIRYEDGIYALHGNN